MTGSGPSRDEPAAGRSDEPTAADPFAERTAAGRPDERAEAGPPEHAGSARPASDRDAVARARRLAAVFGDVLPEATGDDRETEPAADPERWYTENRPPHHDAR